MITYSLLLITFPILSSSSSSSLLLSSPTPDELAKDCLDSLLQLDMIEWCRQGALIKYNPITLHTNHTTVWESCCQAFDEISCYEQQAKQICPTQMFNHFLQYTGQIKNVFLKSFCNDSRYKSDWENYCLNLVQNAIKNQTIELYVPKSNDRQINDCLQLLQNKTSDGDRIAFCRNDTMNVINTKFEYNIDIEIFCCAQYNFTGCIEQEARKYCQQSQQSHIEKWWQDFTRMASDRFCKAEPYYDDDGNNHLNETTRLKCHQYGYDLYIDLNDDSSHKSGKWWVVIPIAILVAGLIAAIYYYKYHHRY